MSKQNILIAMLCLTSSILCGCGTKGPLYIPEQRYPQAAEKTHAPQATVIALEKPTSIA